MKRRVVIALAGLWGIALLFAVYGGGVWLARSLPGIGASPHERADIDSGDLPYHRFLLDAARVRPESKDILLLAHDPSRNDLFQFYRAAYRLYPLRVWFVPVQFGPSGEAKFRIKVGSKLHALVRDRSISLAGIYEKPSPEASAFYAIEAVTGDSVEFSLLEVPSPSPGESPPGYGSRRPALWLVGLASLLLFGWLANSVSGLSASFRNDPASLLSLALVSGAGLTAWIQIVVSLAGVPLSLSVVLAPWCVVVAVAGWRRFLAGPRPAPAPSPPTPSANVGIVAWRRADVAGIALVAFSGCVAIAGAAAPLSAWSNWDAWAIWFFKAKACWIAGGIPFDFLKEGLYKFAHSDYPLGLPMVNNYLAMWTGGLDARFLRGLSPLYLVALGCLLARLLLELKVVRGRWLLAGAFSLVPIVLNQGSNGYVDLPLACAMTACLLLLVIVLKGNAAPWTIGFAGGMAAMTKDEGLLWACACLAVVVFTQWMRHRRAASKSRLGPTLRRIAVAGLVLVVLAAPWKIAARSMGFKPKDYVMDPGRMIRNLPARAPVIVKAVFLEALGPGVTMAGLAGTGQAGIGSWFNHVRNKWLLLWVTVFAGVVLGYKRLLTFPLREVAGVILLQASAYGAVYLASTLQSVSWHLVTSVDRLMLQLAPAAWALACGLLMPCLFPSSPPPASGKP